MLFRPVGLDKTIGFADVSLLIDLAAEGEHRSDLVLRSQRTGERDLFARSGQCLRLAGSAVVLDQMAGQVLHQCGMVGLRDLSDFHQGTVAKAVAPEPAACESQLFLAAGLLRRQRQKDEGSRNRPFAGLGCTIKDAAVALIEADGTY